MLHDTDKISAKPYIAANESDSEALKGYVIKMISSVIKFGLVKKFSNIKRPMSLIMPHIKSHNGVKTCITPSQPQYL